MDDDNFYGLAVPGRGIAADSGGISDRFSSDMALHFNPTISEPPTLFCIGAGAVGGELVGLPIFTVRRFLITDTLVHDTNSEPKCAYATVSHQHGIDS